MNQLLEKIDALLEMLDTSPALPTDWGWVTLTRMAEAAAEEARQVTAPALADATALCARLAAMAASGEVPIDDRTAEVILDLERTLHRLRDDLAEHGQITIPAKSELARVELYLKDFATAPEPPDEDEASGFGLDIDQELLGRIQSMETAILDLIPDAPNLEGMKTLFREFHTLKGEAGLVALGALQSFCHEVESLLEPARETPIPITPRQIDSLLGCVDICRTLLAAGKKPPAEKTLRPVLVRLKNAFERVKEVSTSEETRPTRPGPNPAAETRDEDEADLDGPDLDREPDVQSTTQSVDVQKLDAIMSVSGEINRLYQALVESVEQLPDETVSVLAELGRNCRQLGHHAAALRMVTARSLFHRTRRVIRDLARQSGKRVQVILEGRETPLDRRLVEALTAPLVHLVRNAIDHGIELPAERRECGKSETATITLRASRVGSSQVAVAVEDDGRGIDEDRVLARAHALGLVAPGETPPRDQLVRLVFHEGLSTAEQVANVSGRGVGMAAVERAAAELHGKVQVHAKSGQGTRVVLRLPLNLAALDSLIARVGPESYLVPLTQVVQLLRFQEEIVSRIQGYRERYPFGDVHLPLIRLHEHFAVTAPPPQTGRGVVVVVRDSGRWAGLLVDEAASIQQVVVRAQEHIFARVPGLAGAAGFGRGQLGLLLDVGELLQGCQVPVTRPPQRRQTGSPGSDKVEVVEIGANRVAMITFTLDMDTETDRADDAPEAHFAINAFKVREFIPHGSVTRFPGSVAGYTGTTILRGEAVPVFDLKQLLGPGKDRLDSANAITMICEFSGRTIGFQIARVMRILNLSWNDIQPPSCTPSGPDGEGSYAMGTILDEDRLILALDFEKILQDVMPLYESFSDRVDSIQRRKANNVVLLVEDSRPIRARLAATLRQAGIEVHEAANGQEALDHIHALLAEASAAGGHLFDRLDLVLTDIEMPVMDGYTLTRTIKTHPELRVLPVILHSSLTNETVERRAGEVGGDGLVSKCNPEALVASLRRYL